MEMMKTPKSIFITIVLLLEETNTTNEKAQRILGCYPKVQWKESIDLQIEEMHEKQKEKMKMNKIM
jgi:hypothetical protein